MNKKLKVVIGLSGGVDSAIAAYLLKKQGYEVIAVFMRNWDSYLNNEKIEKEEVICPQEKDYLDAKKVAKILGIKIFRKDFISEYWKYVFKNLINSYKKGITPNPDILCNKKIKFGLFYKWAFKKFKNLNFIATGHYAKIENNLLKIPLDKDKDQTYFLAQVKKNILSKTIFPLADVYKKDVRKLAKKIKLPVFNKKDSTGICFIGERNFQKFLKNYIKEKPGKIISLISHKVIGTHKGTHFYTIGQRKGLNLSGKEERYFIAKIDSKKNTIYVLNESNDKFLISRKALIKNVNWFLNKKNNLKNIKVKFRYRSQPIECSIKWSGNNLIVHYPQGFKAVTPGQQAVFYQNDICLGGGFIKKIWN